MKKFNIKTLVAAILLVATLVSLVACGGKKNADNSNNNDNSTDNTVTQQPTFDAASAIAGFADKVNTTVKLTYVTNYKVDVVRPGADASGLASFKRDVVATAVVEMDLGSDLYIKVTKTRQDKLVDATAITTEEILFQKDGKYYYQTSSATAVEVADAAAKLAEIFESATYEQVGGLSLDALLYNSLDKEYELKVFALSDTFYVDELADPTYAAGENGGLKVTYKPDYVGYRTDGGWSDFPGADGAAADIEILTNDKGYVTSMKETYNNASLVFNIMSNPPTVTINGERSFTATYGEAITKADSVELAPSKAVYEEAVGGSFAVMTCPMGQFTSMSPVVNGGDLTLGNIICIKPTANEGYELVKVVVNGNETPMINPAQAGGFYCFNVAPGTNTIEVMFRTSDPTVAVVDVKNNTGVNFMLQSFTYGANGPEGYKTITDGVIEPGQSIFGAILVTSNDEVVVTVNGVATSINIPAPTGTGKYYCFAVNAGGKYDVVISKPGEAVSGNGIVHVDNNTSYEYQLQSFVYANGAPSDYKVIENGEIEPGASVFGAIVISADTPVTVTVNGAVTSVNIPSNGVVFYCFSVKEGGEFNVVIDAQ